jgi:NAD(P)-dependent dehydrogenase (short-subunit alcohol dehydrogenase family)
MAVAPPASGSAHGHGIRSLGLVVSGIRFADEIRLHHGFGDRNRRGTLDLLINNAGYSPREGVIEAANMTEYRRAFEVNFWGPLQVVQAMMPLLRRSKGRIINTTSASVYMSIPVASAYPASKAALMVFTQHLRMELAPFGTRSPTSYRVASRPRWSSWDLRSTPSSGR